MKKILLIILFIFLTIPSFGNVEFDIFKNSNPKASEILYKYILDTTNSEFIKSANITKNSCFAFFYDLNSDEKNEIVGSVMSGAYQGTAGFSLFILQEEENKYKNLSYIINFYPQKNIVILNSKTSGYYDINCYGNKQYERPLQVKYDYQYKLYRYFF